jgi:Flp pilus assembly protein TadG
MTKELVRDQRGAVLAEFVIVAIPLFVTFFSFAEVAHVAVANLMVRHATVSAARAASVISNGRRNTPDQPAGTNDAEIRAAVRATLGNYSSSMASFEVEIQDDSTCEDYFGMVTVTVVAHYKCAVPLGSLIVCGADRTKTLTHVAQLPHQGARYKSERGGGGCAAKGSK